MSSEPETFSLRGYFLQVLMWLPLFFVFWYFLAGFFNILPVLASRAVINLLHDGLIVQLESAGRHIDYITSLSVSVPGETRKGNVVVTLNPLIYSWNIPVLLALCYAVSDKLFSNLRVIMAVAGLFVFHTWGLTAELFASLLFRQGSEVAAQMAYSDWQRELVAFAYQFGYLMLPVIGAVSLWFLVNRSLVLLLMNPARE